VAKLAPYGVDPFFFWSIVSSDEYQDRFFKLADGAAQPNMSGSQIENINILIPPLNTQRKIAGVLSAYDDLIENNSRRIAILEEMAQAIYREWFVNFRFPGHENVKLIDSPLGKIPEGWEVMPFSKSADFVNGYAFKPSDWATTGIPIVKIAELKNGITKKTPRYSGVELPEKYTVKTGDLLFSWSADLDAYIWPHEDGLLNQHLFTVLPFTKFTKQFLFFALLHKMPQFRSLSIGTTMRHIKRSALDQVSFVSPPSILLDEFTKQTQPLIEHVIAATKKLRVLTATRDLLLPKLISGQLDVEDLDIEIGEQPEEATT
jgi:type I restriction enzyme S subunit